MTETFFSKNLNYLVKEMRHICNQNQLSVKMKVSRQMVTNYIKGYAEPNFKNLIAICDTYSVKIDDMLTKDLSK